MKAFSIFPIVKSLIDNLVQADLEIIQNEQHLEPVKVDLIHRLPILTPDNFTWMKAADYFMCRSAHGIPLVSGTEVYMKYKYICQG